MKRERAPIREIFGWAMFDFANSSYTTVIITVVFSVIFPRLIVGDIGGTDPEFRVGNLLWSVALAISNLLIVITAPVFGTIMDYTAGKKRFLFASYVVTVIGTMSLYFVTPGAVVLGIILVIVSNVGFGSGEDFISAFLPDLGPPKDLGKISGFAWGLGYIGGLLSTSIVVFGLGAITPENVQRLRLVGPITGIFFLVAALPTFLFLRERGTAATAPAGSYIRIALRRLRTTVSEIGEFRDLVIFLVSLFFSMAGLSIVVSFAFIYGDQVIRWDATTQVVMFVITQITAAAGALVFGLIQDRIGSKRTYGITIVLWVVAITGIYFNAEVTDAWTRLRGKPIDPEIVFLMTGSIAGACMGATQSAGRTLVGLFSPHSKSGEFFGFWGISGKLAAIAGLLGIGFLQSIFGLAQSILLCSAFFVIAFVVNLFVDEPRGIAAAAAHEGE